jgi:hypothetical protein
VAVKFWTTLPALSRWPSASFAVPGADWQEHLAAADFQRIAAAAGRLGHLEYLEWAAPEVMPAFR